MTTALDHIPNRHPAGPVLDREQVELLKNTICKGATDAELDLFVTVCNLRGLNPFTGQIHFVKRNQWNPDANDGKGGYEKVATFQTGIDGYRLIADRTGSYAGPAGTWWCGPDGEWRDVWLEDAPPAAAKVALRKAGYTEPIVAIARWNAYVQRKRDGKPNRMWEQMGAEMLAKCFSEDTEVLTDQGFQRFSEVTGRILQVTPDGLWPTDAKPFSQPYQGPMITLDSDDLNFSVTPNHDMVTTVGKVEASDLYDQAHSRPHHWIPRNVAGEGIEFPVKDEAIQLAAAYLADGSDNGGRFRIEVSRPRKVDRLRGLGLHLDEQQRRTAGAVAHTAARDIVTRSDKARFVYDLGQVAPLAAAGKQIDVNALLVLSRRQARLFVDTLIFFDGSTTTSGVRRWRSVRPDHLAAFEVAAVRAGYAVNVPRERRSDISARTTYEVTISDRSEIPVIRWGREHSRSKGNVTGRTGLHMTYTYEPVWCVTVPSGEIVVRRHGFSMRCGNCAEALAFRKGFPQELSGLYVHEEMTQADTSTVVTAGGAVVDAETGELVSEPARDEPAAQGNGQAQPMRHGKDVDAWRKRATHLPDPDKEMLVRWVNAKVEGGWRWLWRSGTPEDWSAAFAAAGIKAEGGGS